MRRFALIGVGAVAGFAIALAVLPSAQGADDANRYLDLLSNALARVRENYVRPVRDSELIGSAIQGMVSSLDPHSRYMNAEAYAVYQSRNKGEDDGIGIELIQQDGLIKIVSSVDGSPAAEAGIKPGDVIAAIDGVSANGLAIDDAASRIRGPNGSVITITVTREGEKDPFDVTMKRAVVAVDAPSYRRENDVGYIRVPEFNEQTAKGVENAVHELQGEIGPNIKGYVLDLRNNPGGLLDQAIALSDDFLSSGEVVSTRGRQSEDNQRYDANNGDITGGKPLVVLIDAGTASASEIVCGALQDNKRATIVGMTSFGKGSVQTVIPLADGGGALVLTTARYYTPSGRSIQAQGITPDIPVAQTDEADTQAGVRTSEADLSGHLPDDGTPKKENIRVLFPVPGKKYDDFQLSFALDLLRGKGGALAAMGNGRQG